MDFNRLYNENLPKLYHGSMYEQNELMPGYKRSGQLVEWDRIENNTWLYATTEEPLAIALGIVSGWEKTFDMVYTSIDHKEKLLAAQFEQKVPDRQALFSVPVYLYEIAMRSEDKWVRPNNPYNGIESEYKTHSTIKDAILSRRKIDILKALYGYRMDLTVKPKE